MASARTAPPAVPGAKPALKFVSSEPSTFNRARPFNGVPLKCANAPNHKLAGEKRIGRISGDGINRAIRARPTENELSGEPLLFKRAMPGLRYR